MTQEVAQIVTLFLTAIAAIGALWAAREARRSARAAKDIGEAQLLVHFLDQYASDEMLKSFRTLRNWEKNRVYAQLSTFSRLPTLSLCIDESADCLHG